jgi:hypothetical protein
MGLLVKNIDLSYAKSENHNKNTMLNRDQSASEATALHHGKSNFDHRNTQ